MVDEVGEMTQSFIYRTFVFLKLLLLLFHHLYKEPNSTLSKLFPDVLLKLYL